MFERVRTSPKRIAAVEAHETYELTEDELKKVRKSEIKRRTRLTRVLAGVAIVTSSASFAYWTDVQHNRDAQVEADAQLSFKVIAEPKDEENSHKAIILFDGRGAYNSDLLAKTIGPAAQQLGDGYIISAGYNNASISREAIKEGVIEEMDNLGVTEVSLDGYSAGGIIATEGGADIVQDSNLNVDVIVNMSTPSGPKGLNPARQANLAFSQWVTKNIPGATDSSVFLFANEMISRSGNYTKGELKPFWNGQIWQNIGSDTETLWDNTCGFVQTTNEVLTRINDPKNPSGRLFAQQSFKIQQFDAKSELKKIADQRDEKQMPTYVDIETDDNSMVDDHNSMLDLRADAKENNIDFYSTKIKAQHGLYFLAIPNFDQGFKTLSVPVNHNVEIEKNLQEVTVAARIQQQAAMNDALSVRSTSSAQ